VTKAKWAFVATRAENNGDHKGPDPQVIKLEEAPLSRWCIRILGQRASGSKIEAYVCLIAIHRCERGLARHVPLLQSVDSATMQDGLCRDEVQEIFITRLGSLVQGKR